MVEVETVGEPVSGNDFVISCTATFYPGVPLENVTIELLLYYEELSGDRVEVNPIVQINETTFVREVRVSPLLVTDSANYTCLAYASGDFLFSDQTIADLELVVERKSMQLHVA